MIKKATLSSLLLVLISHLGFAEADSSINHSVQASAHSGKAIAHTLTAGGKLVLHSVAIPFSVAGHIGQVSDAIADDLTTIATSDIGEALPVTDKLYLAGPSPDKAMQQ
jgi:hypothetical protein